MQRHECGIERIYDLVALRVVLHPELTQQDESSNPMPPGGMSGGMGGGWGGSSMGGDGGGDGPSASESAATEAENALCYHVLGKVHRYRTRVEPVA